MNLKDIERAKKKVTPTEIKRITRELFDCGAVIPLIVYCPDFQYIVDGNTEQHIVKGSPSKQFESYPEAAEEFLYLYFTGHSGNKNQVNIVNPLRIVDSENTIVYTKK